MDKKFLVPKNRAKVYRDNGPIIRVVFLIIASIIIIYVLTTPYRNYLSKNLISKGEEMLVERKYVSAYVNFLKASILAQNKKDSEQKMALSKKASEDIGAIKNILQNKNPDLYKLLEISEQKSCDLENDKLMIEKDLSQIAIINLKFCAEEGPKNYESWLYLGSAYWQLSESDQIFKEQKPNLRDRSISAFEQAYYTDPTKKSALEKLIELNKITGNQEKVDYWQRLLDNLGRFSS